MRLHSGPTAIEPADFDAIGVMTDLVVALRAQAFEREADAVGSVSAPPGRHRLNVIARGGGHVVLSVRYDELSLSRRNVIAGALARRSWDLDEDTEGATRRYPPGTDATTVAFEALAVLTLGGVRADPRTIDYG